MSEAITVDDLDALEESPAAVAGPINPELSGDVPRPAPAAASSEPDPASVEADPEPELEEIDPVVECNERLDAANERCNRARRVYEKALAEVSEINRELAGYLQARSEIPLHVLNANQDKITRPEQVRTITAREALSNLQAHFRPGKRQYPVHPSQRAVVSGGE